MFIGSVLLLFVIDSDGDYQRSIYLSFINLGIGASVVAVNVSAVLLIPHQYLINMVLIITLFSNFISAFAPLTAYNFKQPVPIYIMAGCSLMGMILPCFMTYHEHEREPTEQADCESIQMDNSQTPEVPYL